MIAYLAELGAAATGSHVQDPLPVRREGGRDGPVGARERGRLDLVAALHPQPLSAGAGSGPDVHDRRAIGGQGHRGTPRVDRLLAGREGQRVASHRHGRGRPQERPGQAAGHDRQHPGQGDRSHGEALPPGARPDRPGPGSVPEARIGQRPGELSRAPEAVRRHLLERPPDRGVHVGRNGAPLLPHRRGRLRDDLAQHRLRRAPRVRRLAGEHLVQHAPQRVEVRGRAHVRVARRLLRAHVVRGPQGEPRLRQPPAARRAHRQRDPEVREHRPARHQQNVRRLHVPVDHAVLVRVLERFGHVGGDLHRLVHWKLVLAVELPPQRLSLHVRHDVVEERVGVARVEQREDARVLQVGGGADLGQEALAAHHGGQLGLEDLEGDPAVVLQVLGQVDRGHAALAELALEAVAALEGGGQARERVRHRGDTASIMVGA